MKYKVPVSLLAGLLAFFIGCAVSEPNNNSDQSGVTQADLASPPSAREGGHEELWYLGQRGLGKGDRSLPKPIPDHVRSRFRAPRIDAKDDNSWIVWFTAFPKNGTRGGKAYVLRLSMEWIGEGINGHDKMVRQEWSPGGVVWGGWFPYDAKTWFRSGMIGKEDFAISEARFTGYGGHCAEVDTTRYADRPAAGHIWMCRWPRDVAPAGTRRIRVHAIFQLNDHALGNVGLDRYRLRDADPEPEQEVLVSDTYSAEEGLITVTMETVDINWRK